MSGNGNDNQEMMRMKEQEQIRIEKQWYTDDIFEKLQYQDRKEFDRMERNQLTLKENKRSIFGIQRNDSKEMQNVKTFQEKVVGLLRDEIPTDTDEFRANMEMIENEYTNLIQATSQYIKTHKNPRSDMGKARLNLVKETHSLALHELRTLRDHAERLRQIAIETEKHIFFSDALANVRGAQFNLDQHQTEQTGAGTSEVTVISVGGKKLFFKAKEELCTPKEEFKRKYEQRGAEIYEKLNTLLGNRNVIEILDFMNFNQAETDAQLEENLDRFKNNIAQMGILIEWDFEDKQMRELLKEAILQYKKWKVRSDVCTDANIDNGENLSDRNILTSRTAVLLKISNVVANSNTVTLHKGGENAQTGIAMQQAKGISYGKVLQDAEKAGKEIIYTPEAMRQFSNLQLLDSVCGQVDRHAGNIFVTSKEMNGKIVITGVQGIDNDMAFGKISFQNLSERKRELPPFIDKNGKCTLPAVDEKMFRMMQAMTKEDLGFFFGDMLKPEYLDALWDRWQGVVQVIENDAKKLLVKEGQWNDAVVEKFQGYGGYAAV